MKILGIIPARGGSKRLPNKNISDLGGVPLVYWSLDVAMATCDAVAVSTDSEEIQKAVALHLSGTVGCPSVTVIGRPADLAQDDTPSELVVIHAVRAMMPKTWDAVLLLQPTSPFRTADDVRGAVAMMERTDADSVISVVPFPAHDMLFTIGHAGRLRPVEPGHVWTPNGAVYLVKTGFLLAGGSWYGEHAYGYVMPAERSLDIDTHADMDAARAMLDKVPV